MTFIHPDAQIGLNNKIGPNVFIGPNVKIGDNNVISGFSSIGMEAEHRDFFDKPGPVIIGNNNIIREFTTINSGTIGVTKIGNHCLMLRGSHLGHDAELEDMANVSCNVLIGGHSLVMEGANLGLGAMIHQRQIIGSYSMIGMGAVVTKNLQCIPGNIYAGNPAKFLKQNTIGLQRGRISDSHLMQEIARYEKIRFKRA